MVVSGVPKENGILHAGEIASMALDLVDVCKTFKIPHKPNTLLKIRAGIHSGMLRKLQKSSSGITNVFVVAISSPLKIKLIF